MKSSNEFINIDEENNSINNENTNIVIQKPEDNSWWSLFLKYYKYYRVMEEAQSNNQQRMGMGVVLKKAPTAKGDTEELEGGNRIIPIPKSFKGISE